MPLDIAALRVFVYEQLIDLGAMPTSDDVARRFGVAPTEARDAIRGARIGKTILARPDSGEIWMAGPFAAEPTPYRVRTLDGARGWWANCAWDMLGIASLVGEPVEIDARCTDCGAPIPMRVASDPPALPDAVVHFLVPARRWYDDIGFT